MTKKQLTDEEWEVRIKLEEKFINELKSLFARYEIDEFEMRTQRLSYGVYFIWKNGLETDLSTIL